LDAAGYTTFSQAWDFEPGQNFILKMRDAAVAGAAFQGGGRHLQ